MFVDADFINKLVDSSRVDPPRRAAHHWILSVEHLLKCPVSFPQSSSCYISGDWWALPSAADPQDPQDPTSRPTFHEENAAVCPTSFQCQALGLQGALDIYLTDSTYSTYACVKAGYLHGVQAGVETAPRFLSVSGTQEAGVGGTKTG